MKKIIILLALIATLCSCGKPGKLFLPGHGKGYYHNHAFETAPAKTKSQHKD